MNLQSILRDILEIADHHADVDDGQPNDWMRVRVLVEHCIAQSESASKLKFSDVPVPKELHGDAFVKAWNQWGRYRSERRLPAYKPIGLKAQLTRLAAMGEARAIAAINYSITQNFQGIYEERQGSSSANPRSSETIGGTKQNGLGPGIYGGKRP